MLGGVGIGTGQQCAVIGAVRQGGPDLVAVDAPAALDPHRAGTQRRQVGSGAGLAEQLTPGQVPTQRGGNETLLQFLRFRPR